MREKLTYSTMQRIGWPVTLPTLARNGRHRYRGLMAPKELAAYIQIAYFASHS